ncbi:MAG: PA2779 family protein [Spirochaetes bacterium]|nr:PA2779 family protein [Spirochaetota bacterium]
MRKPIFTVSIAVYMILFFTAPGMTAMVASSFHSKTVLTQIEKQEKLETIQRALEHKMVQDKLKAYGLNKEEIEKKLKDLSNDQIHILAQASEKLLAGGDSLGLLVTVLVIILLVVLILRLT